MTKKSNAAKGHGEQIKDFVARNGRRRSADEVLAVQARVEEDDKERSARAFHAILMTSDAIFGPASSPRRGRRPVRPKLLRLIDGGVKVFLLTSDPIDAADGINQIVLQRGGDAHHKTIVDAVLDAGIKFDNLLIAIDGRDEFLTLQLRLLYTVQEAAIPDAALRHGSLLLPYSTDGNVEHLFDEAVPLLPVLADGTVLKHFDAIERLIATRTLARPINITELSMLVQEETVLDDLTSIAAKAAANRQQGLKLLRRKAYRLVKPSVEVFDDRSGAVFFRPDDWRTIESHDGELARYFTEKLPDYWQDDRPCYRRILFTPTKVLLRGEQYYANMRNESPFVRIGRMADEMDRIREALSSTETSKGKSFNLHKWKLVLALLDQARNISLQFYSFVHASIRIFSEQDDEGVNKQMSNLRGGRDTGINGLLYASTSAYYAWIFGEYHEAAAWSQKVNERWSSKDKAFKTAVVEAKSRSAKRPLGDLVRRWREADHPGENLLTALIAEESLRSAGVTHAVGIGWGGIELPLVYKHLCARNSNGSDVQVHIAQFSHYRGGTRNNNVNWMPFPESNETFDAKGKVIALFDDNTLTGYTLERVRDDLLLRGAKDVKLFVTRYSGERRYAHMKMSEHGVIDPAVLRDHVRGYIGETPFARSWSAKPKDYKSPIGVFSLARRRILECIHNNSTVQLYDREGF